MAGLLKYPCLLVNSSKPGINRSIWLLSRNVRFISSASRKVEAKPFSDIPGPKGLPFIGNMIGAIKGGAMSKQLHKYMEKQHQKYGPIFKETMGPGYTSVNLSDPKDIEHLLRHEGKYPVRTRIDPWIEYRKQTERDLGVLLG